MQHKQLLDLVKFIESYTLEDKLWFRLQSLFTANTAEVTYYSNTRKWHVDFPGMDVTVSVSSEELPSFLGVRHVDLSDFEAALGQVIMQQVAYAQLLIEKSEQLFGPDVVKAAIQDQVRFRNELVSAVEAALRPKPRLVKE